MKERKSLIPNGRAEAYMPLASLLRIYEVPYKTGLKWIKNNEIKHDNLGSWFVEIGSFAYRNYGNICECIVCHKKWWIQSNQHKEFCSHKCELCHNLLRNNALSEVRLERFLNDNKIDTFGKTIKAIRYRKHLPKATFRESTGISWDRLKLIEAEKVPPPTDRHIILALIKWLGYDELSTMFDRLVELARKDAERIPIPQMIVKATIQRLSKKEWLAISDKPFAYEAFGTTHEETRYNLQKIIQRYVNRLLEAGKKVPTMEKGYTKLEVFVDSRQSPIN